MAVEIEVYFSMERLGSPEGWIERARADGVTFDAPFRPLSHSGYAPARHRGKKTGFEFSIDDVAESSALPSAVRDAAPGADKVAIFRLGEEAELAAASLAAAALTKVTGGVLHDPGDGTVHGAEEAHVRASALTSEVKQADDAQKSKGKTPARWATATLELVKKVHADYARNKAIKQPLLEFVRRDDSGLFASHNFEHHRQTYHQSFALSFSRSRMGPWLNTPLLAGSRFDHNRTVTRQFNDDLGLRRGDPGWPTSLTSLFEWKSNTLPLVEQCFRAAEAQLLPRYRQILADGSAHLVELFETARAFVDTFDSDLETSRRRIQGHSFTPEFGGRFQLPTDVSEWSEHFVLSVAALLRAEEQGLPVRDLWPHRMNCVNLKATDVARLGDGESGDPSPATARLRSVPERLRMHALVVFHIDTFVGLRAELPSIIETARGLARER